MELVLFINRPMDYPKVSIIILNWNGLKDTIKCLESLKKITYSNYEVMVVDNGSKGNDADILEEKYKGYIQIIRNKENLGFAEGNNIGIQYALTNGSKYIWVLNNDVLITDSGIIDKFLKIMEENPKIGVVGPLLFDLQKKSIQTEWGVLNFWGARFEPINKKGKESKIKDLKILKKNEFLIGASLFVKSKVFEKILFPICYFLLAEETDWEERVRKKGWLLAYSSRISHFHKGGGSFGGWEYLSPFFSYYETRNFLYFIEKHYFWYLSYAILRSFLSRVISKFLRGYPKNSWYSFLGIIDYFLRKKGKIRIQKRL